MSSLSLPRKTLLLLLCAVLMTPWAAAAAPRSEAPKAAIPAPLDLLSRTWGLLKSLWSAEGCGIDPDGRCVTRTAPQPRTDTGCGIDPDGRCHG
ncbi:MAG TPA: hypothetical protein VGR07_18515 [Thermoanaerobaculia bacterium]|jgi:hypothetical protein|nr:hypothetical protein [Thermoanaerobaculia bacterium]